MDIEGLDAEAISYAVADDYRLMESMSETDFAHMWSEAERRLRQDARAAGMATCGGAE